MSMKVRIMLEVDETFMMIWLSRSSEVRVKVRRWPQSPIGTIFCVFVSSGRLCIFGVSIGPFMFLDFVVFVFSVSFW